MGSALTFTQANSSVLHPDCAYPGRAITEHHLRRCLSPADPARMQEVCDSCHWAVAEPEAEPKVFVPRSTVPPWDHRSGAVPACRGHQAPALLACRALLYLLYLNNAESLLRTLLLEGLSRKQLMQPLLFIHGTGVQRVIKPQAPFSLIPNYALSHSQSPFCH